MRPATATGLSPGDSGSLESRPETLWRLIDPLHQRFTAGKPIPAVPAEALAEAYFRIGVHPDTEPQKALELLGDAHKLNPANPKHPYHLGLLYLRRGQPGAAIEWLQAAAARSPVNHRVRAHLSIAFRELDAQRLADAGYTGADRATGEKIAGDVRGGVDHFDRSAYGEKPKPAATGTDPESLTTVALIRPGVCRWSGIHDVEAESRLRGRTTERTRDVLAAELETVVGLASRRSGGRAAFTVLAVQWMVCGYPVATIRRLAQRLPPDDGPSARLLELVCELFQTDPAELPGRLAECLAEGSLPDVLAALIHHRRLLWRPLRFPDLGAHTAAREFTEGEPDRHVKALEAARRELDAEARAPMADVPDGSAAALAETTDPDSRLAAFERVASELTTLRGNLKGQIGALAKATKNPDFDYAAVAGDRRLLEDLADGLEQARTAWLADLQQFQEAELSGLAGLVVDFAGYQRRLQDCESVLQESFRSTVAPLKKQVDKRLKQLESEHAGIEPAATPEATDLAARCAALDLPRLAATSAVDPTESSGPEQEREREQAHQAGGAGPEPLGAPAVRATAREQVTAALAAAEQALDANFDRAWQTLEPYPPVLWNRDALVLLRGHLRGRQAEAELRLGRSSAARRRWNSMLADDPLHPGVLHNLAVAHTSAGDPVEAAEAWGRYLEAIYLRDLLHGQIRRGAAARESVHRIFAASFGTAPLCVGPKQDDDDADFSRQIPLLLSSRAKVRLVTEHMRLEELNHIVSHRSPILLLGIGRSDGDGASTARERRVFALRKVLPLLPVRVRDAMEKECLRLLDAASTEASEAKGRVRRSGDQAEEDAHAKWVSGRIGWKRGIRNAVLDGDWPLSDYSGAVVANLALIDAVSLDAKDPLLRDCVQQSFPGNDPDEMIQLLDGISGEAARFALKQILAAGEAAAYSSEADAQRFAEQFRRIGRSWGRNAVPEQWSGFLDDLVQLYGARTESALKILQKRDDSTDDADREILTAAVPVLESWVERLPGATGPARALATVLGRLKRYDDALKVLAHADAEAFSAAGRERVLRERIQLDILRGQFQTAVDTLCSLLEKNPDDEQLRVLLTNAFDRWISSGNAVPEPKAITAAFSRWTDEETVGNRRILALNAAFALHRANSANSSVESLVAVLQEMVLHDPDHLMAHYHLCEALVSQAWEYRDRMRQEAGTGRAALRAMLDLVLADCGRRASALRPRLEGEEYAKHRQQLDKILEEVGFPVGE
ncbi:tetratricopeptide (TPR) repeat protein [Catenulispora sp. MAP12-49]